MRRGHPGLAAASDDDGAVSLNELWSQVRVILDDACSRLTDPHASELVVFNEFVRHNELGLALDVLAEVATAQGAPADVWHALASAAKAMDLTEHDEVHGGTVRLIRTHVDTAPHARHLRQLLNRWDPIGVAPGVDAPDDEYDCLIAPILERLYVSSSGPDIASFLSAEFASHFGLDLDPAQTEGFAQQVTEWWSVERDQ